MATYPTLAAAMHASLEQLCTWCDSLPPPQTDVERTVLRRMLARRDQLAAQHLREKAPDIADKLNDIKSRLERLGIPAPWLRAR